MSSKKHEKEIGKRTIIQRYGLTPALIGKCLPPPRKVQHPGYESAAPTLLWKESDVIRAIEENPEIRRTLERKANKQKEKAKRAQDAADYLAGFSPQSLFEEGKQLTRRFILHIGPTNSGKTYQSLQRLKTAGTGAYLGPLRLLALEVFENLNNDDCPCSLLTGEEHIDVPGSGITASTIELADYSEHYDVAVIDEAQMLADPARGPHWTRAICLIDAEEVHLCLAPEAEELVVRMVEELGSPYEIFRHERLVPLTFSGLFREISEAKPGDALITFSRKGVLQLAAAMEQSKIKASVIYGALPPASRREEVRRFSEKETRVVVATDAIGMGISLPIRRVIFVDTEKFDGTSVRPLNPTEIRQIAGRAGRFGKYDKGDVLTMANPRLIARALTQPIKPITRLTIGFPEEALDYDRPLQEMLKQWDQLPANELFCREDMREAEQLLNKLGKVPVGTDKHLIYTLITCPIDVKNDTLVSYWRECCQKIFRGQTIPRPYFEENTLEHCELQYHAYDVYHQLLRRIGIEDDCLLEKDILSQRINGFLKQKKLSFLKRCRICGREMRIQDKYSICDNCFNRQTAEDWLDS